MYEKSHKKSRTWHQIQDCFLFELLVVADADEVAGLAGGIPGDVEPAVAGEELVGQGVMAQEVDEALELGRIL